MSNKQLKFIPRNKLLYKSCRQYVQSINKHIKKSEKFKIRRWPTELIKLKEFKDVYMCALKDKRFFQILKQEKKLLDKEIDFFNWFLYPIINDYYNNKIKNFNTIYADFEYYLYQKKDDIPVRVIIPLLSDYIPEKRKKVGLNKKISIKKISGSIFRIISRQVECAYQGGLFSSYLEIKTYIDYNFVSLSELKYIERVARISMNVFAALNISHKDSVFLRVNFWFPILSFIPFGILAQTFDHIHFIDYRMPIFVDVPLREFQLLKSKTLNGIFRKTPIVHQRFLKRLFCVLEKNNNKKIDIAVHRLLEADRKESLEDRIIDYWIGLEAIFSPTDHGELTYRISNRLAHLLSNKPNERKNILREVKESYNNFRSPIIHGSIPKDKKVLKKATEKIRGYLVKSLQKILLLLDNKSNIDLNKYLENLTLGL